MLKLLRPEEWSVGLEEVAEGLHAAGLGEGIAALLHQPEPLSDPCNILGHREVLDSRQEVRSRLDSPLVKVEANKLNLFLTEFKLLFGEKDASLATK